MASTYTPQNAIDLVKSFVHGVPLTSVQAAACDMVNSTIWSFYPWSWTLNNLTAITCTDKTQDYTPTDTDILRPIRIQLQRTDVSPVETRELALMANLSPELTRTGGIDTITSVGWYAANNYFRLQYATSISSPTVLKIVGIYQKVPTVITNDNMTTAFAFPDRYFGIFIEGLKYQLYSLADDPKAGTIQVSKNGDYRKVYTGQLGVFREQLEAMARTEDLGSGDEFMWPEQPLGVGRSYWPGLFGV